MDQTAYKMFLARLRTRQIYVVGGALLLVLSSVLLGFAASWGFDTEAFNFIALLILFVSAMAVLAAVFAGLRMNDKQEAFGLPSGSIRALLSIGVMILFVVFGLPLISPDENKLKLLEGKQVASGLRLPPDQLDAATATYVGQGLIVITRSYGVAERTDPSTNQTIPAEPAVIDLLSRDRFAENQQLNREIVVAIITLLTSVISFYFGSRSVTDSIKPPAQPNTTTSEFAIRRKELSARFETLKTALKDHAASVDEAKTNPDPDNPDEVEPRRKAFEAVNARRGKLAEAQAAIDKLINDIDEDMTAVAGSLPPDVRAVHEESIRTGLKDLETKIAGIEGELAAYAAEVQNYVDASARG